MLARVQRLRDGYDFVKKLLDCQEHSVVWGALLGACRKHGGDVQLVKLAAQHFFRLQPGNVCHPRDVGQQRGQRGRSDECAQREERSSLERHRGARQEAHFSRWRLYHNEFSAIYEVCNALAHFFAGISNP
jgi:hypothetical protein